MKENQTISELKTLVDLLRWRATYQADRPAYTYLVDDAETSVTFGELDRQARSIAELLLEKMRPGERALLLYPPGIEYIAAFFGCLYAGVIAIPAYPPRRNRNISRLQAIVADASATVVLTTGIVVQRIAAIVASDDKMKSIPCVATDGLDDSRGQSWQRPDINGETLAFLQYTSGSTANPKGVMVSHANLLHNQKVLLDAFHLNEESVVLGWLPIYHDMGLIGTILHPLYVGARCVFMAPTAFLHSPFLWLSAMSRYKAAASAAPNFAYDLCVHKISAQQRATLDLSHWRVAINGAEPIRAATLDRFVEAFGPCGFKREAFSPMYGLAEATLVVSGSRLGESPEVTTFLNSGLASHRALVANNHEPESRQLVSCGGALLDQRVAIVAPETEVECAPGEVGEIWLSSPSVARGYWNRPEATQQTFRAQLSTGEGPFMRTGDLGFLHQDQLYVTGRLKDMIIIRGQNHYPQDIELTAESAHLSLRRGCGAAFSVDDQGEERLVIVQEVEHGSQADYDEVIDSIRQTVTADHALQVHAVALLKTGSISKTSSGKIQRHACKQRFLNNGLEAVKEWRAGDPVAIKPVATEPAAVEPPASTAAAGVSGAAIRNWLVAELAARTRVQPAQIDTRQPFSSYGLDSAESVKLAGDLERWLGRRVPPTLAWDFPTIEAVSAHLASDEPKVSAPAAGRDQEHHVEPIAIIGLSCRFPGADGPEAFWRLLKEGTDTISEAPKERWNVDELYDANLSSPGKMNTRWGGFVDRIDEFDPVFFGISTREAASMDPQQRLLLEVTWEALEQSGIAPKQLEGSRTGVFIGISSCDYYRLHAAPPARAGTGIANSIAANRISYFFDFRGPSLVIDTACSSSLVALHLACQNLRSGESDMALAGGVNLMISPELTVTFSQAGMMAADGRCKSFDAGADGYVRGEGCGVVVLKRLSDALADGDNILALVRGSSVNQDGRSNGLTAPNGLAQQQVIRQALKDAEVSPHEISYVEAHGSGTPLGDAIEIQALTAVVAEGRPQDQPCLVGSVKTNIGHLEAAAGIAGLIKVVLSLGQNRIPPHLHLKNINPHLALDEKILQIPTAPASWPAASTRHLAGISSFGFGGTNAHVIVEQAPAVDLPAAKVERPVDLLTLSAKSEGALRQMAARLHHRLMQEVPHLADICHTANTGRALFSHRLAVVARSEAGLRDQLAAFANGQKADGTFYKHAGDRRPSLTFLFSGQGAPSEDVGRTLYEAQPTFRDAIDQCDAVLQPYLARPLLGVLYPSTGEHRNGHSLIHQAEYAQPALFALAYALAQLWMNWGIHPDAVIGHGIGEYVAACIAGVVSLETALRLVVERARLLANLTGGAGTLVIAADNTVFAGTLPAAMTMSAASDTTISGDHRVVAVMPDRQEGPQSQPYNPGLHEFEALASRFRYHEPQITMVSSITGEKFEPGQIPGAAYWCEQIRKPMDFYKSMQTLNALGQEVYLEIGPSETLTEIGKTSRDSNGSNWIPSLQKSKQEWDSVLEATARLYLAGVDIDWTGFDRDYPRRRVALPTYPFQRKRCWLEPSEIHHPKMG
jgi:acyl transferase domain-containing protein/acyl-CoA synthetase (AMP-forming)/AMP-acid ligase II/acyl carrier protein